MVDRQKRNVLISIILALGLWEGGQAAYGTFSIDHDGKPPTLDTKNVALQQLEGEDFFVLTLPFDRPVGVSLVLLYEERKKSDPAYIVRREKTWDYRDLPAQQNLFWTRFTPTGKTFGDCNVQDGQISIGDYLIKLTSVTLRAKSIGGEEMAPMELLDLK